MPKVCLTDLSLQKLSPGTYWDEKLPAFGVRIGKNKRSFIVMPSQRRIRKIIGHYPTMPLSKARGLARTMLATRGNFHDITFDEALEQFLAVLKARTRPKTYYEAERLLRRHFSPKLASRTLSDLNTPAVMGIVDGLLETPSEAGHAFVAARQFFRWAAGRGYCAHLLQSQQPPAKTKRRSRVLTDDEIRKLLAATGTFADYCRLLLLTGQRRGEVRRAIVTGDTLTIPADVSKNHREHTIPLGNLAAQYWRPYPNFAWSREKARLDTATGLANWTLHDLRRTFRTGLGKLGIAPHIAERVVNHVSAQTEVERTYDQHTYWPDFQKAIELWEAHILQIAADQNEPRNGKHVQLAGEAIAA